MMKRSRWVHGAALAAILGGGTAAFAQEAVSETDALFTKLDKNNDGQLTKEEVPEVQARFFERLVRLGDKDKDGVLTNEMSIAPNGGKEFGPRHLDFHPTKPWMYVSIETQNKMYTYKMDGGKIDPKIAYRAETLAEPKNIRSRQAATNSSLRMRMKPARQISWIPAARSFSSICASKAARSAKVR